MAGWEDGYSYSRNNPNATALLANSGLKTMPWLEGGGQYEQPSQPTAAQTVSRGAKGAASLGLGVAMAGLAAHLGTRAVVGLGRLGVRGGKRAAHKLGILR